jgi:hypothetical protein
LYSFANFYCWMFVVFAKKQPYFLRFLLPFLQNLLQFWKIGIMAIEKTTCFCKKRHFLCLTNYRLFYYRQFSDIFSTLPRTVPETQYDQTRNVLRGDRRVRMYDFKRLSPTRSRVGGLSAKRLQRSFVLETLTLTLSIVAHFPKPEKIFALFR